MKTSMIVGIALGVAVAVGAVAGFSCGDSEPSFPPGTIGVTMNEFTIKMTSTTLHAGDITFSVRNDGEMPHEFVILKTDIAADKLATNAAGGADEEQPGVDHVDEIEDVPVKGGTGTLKVTLVPGKYIGICNIDNHYQLKMYQTFTVQ